LKIFRSKYCFFLLLILFLFPSNKPVDPNSKIKVIFLYNFTKYIEWPVEYKTGDFVIGVLGVTLLMPELDNLSKTKMIGSQKCVIKYYNQVKDIQKCHMLFIPTDKSEDMESILKQVKGMNTLIITEKAGYAKKGAAINFVSVDNKQKFELNKANVGKYGLKVSSTLLSLGIIVDK
jgi:hypothetical protein